MLLPSTNGSEIAGDSNARDDERVAVRGSADSIVMGCNEAELGSEGSLGGSGSLGCNNGCIGGGDEGGGEDGGDECRDM